MEGNIGLDFTSKIIKFPAVFRLQDKAQFHVQFPTHVQDICGKLYRKLCRIGNLTICKRSGKVQFICTRGYR